MISLICIYTYFWESLCSNKTLFTNNKGSKENIVTLNYKIYSISILESYYNINWYINSTHYSSLQKQLNCVFVGFPSSDISLFEYCVGTAELLCFLSTVCCGKIGVYWATNQKTSIVATFSTLVGPIEAWVIALLLISFLNIYPFSNPYVALCWCSSNPKTSSN